MAMCDHTSTGQPPVGARRLNRFVVPGVLLLLAEEPTHGYELGSRLAGLGFIENESDTALVYRALADLSSRGCITVSEEPGEGGPRRKVYALAPSGRELLEQWRAVIEERVDVLSRFLERYSVLKPEED
ncbi:MAG: PadR family transcriptional regulator [Actinomycetota bacterium]